MKFAIIGGDLRIVKLAEMLAKEENEVYVYGLDKVEDADTEIYYSDSSLPLYGSQILRCYGKDYDLYT